MRSCYEWSYVVVAAAMSTYLVFALLVAASCAIGICGGG